MGIKRCFSWLLLIPLAGLLSGGFVFSVSAQEGTRQAISISPMGQGKVLAVAYSPNGQSLAVGSSLGITFFGSSDLQQKYFVPTDTWVRALDFSPDGTLLASGSYDSTVRLWRVSDGALSRELSGHTAWVRDVAFSPSGEILATASDDNTVRLWNVSDGSIFRILDQNVPGIRALAFSPDGSILATGGFDRIIRLWNVSDGTLLKELKGHKDWVRALVFSPNGEFLASGAFDATVRLWHVGDGALLTTREEHSSSVLGLAFSPDGQLLASASVDTSVRLWKMPTLEPYSLLRGHTDFVYSVAFSPDGKSLVSGAADNTMRVWKVPEVADLVARERVLSPSSCKACHHPQGQQGSPRVVETECSVCHGNGARVLNWCLAFPRSSGNTTRTVQLQSDESAGVYHSTTSSSVIIYSPGNGEVVYGRSSISYPLLVAGKVQFQGNLSDIKLILEIQAENGPSIYVESFPFPDGSFSFVLKGNHGSARPVLLGHSTFARQALCLSCHTGYSDADLPDQGAVRLRVTAVDPDGRQSWDERNIYVDSGGTAVIPVKVLIDGNPSIVDIPIRAVTRLYEWRERTFTATIDSHGEANLQVEALSQDPTIYQLSIPPTVIGGLLYESKDSVQVTLPPGATSAPAVTLNAYPVQGEINGHVQAGNAPTKVWAIRLPYGDARYTTISSDGSFTFSNLPVGQVLLTFDSKELAEKGLSLPPENIDLMKSPDVDLELSPRNLKGVSLSGRIADENGGTLPFGWAKIGSDTGQTDPSSGIFDLSGLPGGNETILISAPGYYSQAHFNTIPTADGSPLSYRLIIRPETRRIPWGGGAIVIPSETIFRKDGQNITFEQGWIWGTGESVQPLVIEWEAIQITIPGGRFALEHLPGRSGWLYMIDGQATIKRVGSVESVTVQAGEMIHLDQEQELHPVSYDPVVVRALRLNSEMPMQTAWQPSLDAQVRDWLARIGIGTAQIVTFITYFMEVLALLSMSLLAVNWIRKNLKEKKT